MTEFTYWDTLCDHCDTATLSLSPNGVFRCRSCQKSTSTPKVVKSQPPAILCSCCGDALVLRLDGIFECVPCDRKVGA